MSLEKIVAEAMAGRPLEMKEAFEEEIQTRITSKLEEKYVEMMEAKSKDDDEDEDDDDDEDESSEDESDDDDDDEDDEKVGKAMKAMNDKGSSKAEVLKAMKEKYGCAGSKAEGLYASYCG